nr:MAG TPA: hypothetical protein [Ackermannviridae sp.]DAW82288.1 MAG TPA: hypothetical protein [Bacteriophage sp.]
MFSIKYHFSLFIIFYKEKTEVNFDCAESFYCCKLLFYLFIVSL